MQLTQIIDQTFIPTSAALLLDQTSPQTMLGGAFAGSGLIKLTSGLLGVDTTSYVPYTGAGSTVNLNTQSLSAGAITGTSFITSSNIGIAAHTDLIQLTGANTVLVNGTGQFTSLGIGEAPVAGRVISAIGTYTNTSGSLFAMRFVPTITPATDSTSLLHGFACYPTGTGSKNISSLIGFYAQPDIETSAGTIGSAVGFRSQPYKGGNSTATYVAGVECMDTDKGAGTITTLYGVRIRQQTTGATNWQLYSNAGNFYIGAGGIATDTTTGLKIGTATSQLLGFYNATPVDQPATVSDPTGGLVTDAECRTAVIAIIDRLIELGLISA